MSSIGEDGPDYHPGSDTVNLSPVPPTDGSSVAVGTKRIHVMTPVRDEAEATARTTITGLLSAGWYVFADKTPGRKHLKPGVRICFYESGVGVVAAAEVASAPQRKPPAAKGVAKDLEKFPWSFKLANPRFFFEQPVALDADLRSKLDAFADRDPSQPWSWFVQGTKLISEHDFAILTRQSH